ncbi:MAG TPA: IPT/TIG domain-containing protein, partial [Verrucomicrobiae bacterium]|nr:IPT/TIG domain-containing protein [Verrucomicrobiae bacterium]
NATGPIITDFSPVLGPAGSPVTIDGINFTSATTVKFGTVTASPKLVGDTQLSVLVPAGAVSAAISVSGNSTTDTTTSNFTVTSIQPVITSTVPLSGVRGQSVTINGANFTNLTATAVQFDGVTTTYQTPTSTTVLTPAVPAGAFTGYITVNNTSGSGVSPALFYLQPWITGFGAPGGIVNSTLLLNGRSLTNATSVTVNGIEYAFTNSNTQIGAIIPTNATTGLVEVVTPGGIFITTNQFDILPKIYTFGPVIGPAGTVVTIDGTSLFNVSKVEFGGVSATPTTVLTNELQVAVPTGAKSGPLIVVTPYGSDVSSNDFTATKQTLLFLRKTVFPTLATTGDPVTFTLSVTNAGTSIATSLIVTDSIPNNLIVLGANATVGSITNSGGNLLWTFPILDTNDSAKMQVVATASTPSAITNIAHLGFAEGNQNTDSNFSYAFSYFVSTAQQTISVQIETNSNQLFLSWPVSPAAFSLESSTNLAVSNAWQFAPTFITNGLNCFTDTISGPAKFYRLAW